MRFVDRSEIQVPASLADINSPAAAELVEARVYYGTVPPPKKCFEFKAYKSHDVRVALRGLFRGCCAYCEAVYEGTQQVDVEHYRPKGGVEGNPNHPGYWWLAMRWDNLLPSCADCNRRRTQTAAAPGMTLAELQDAFESNEGSAAGKLNAFPTSNGHWAQPEADPTLGETPLLIDPTRDDPNDYLIWKLDGEIPILVARSGGSEAISPKGQMSIDVYGLNRFGLVQSRLRVLRLMESISAAIEHLIENIDELNDQQKQQQLILTDQIVQLFAKFTEDGSPHVSMALSYVERVKSSLAGKLTQAEMLEV